MGLESLEQYHAAVYCLRKAFDIMSENKMKEITFLGKRLTTGIIIQGGADPQP